MKVGYARVSIDVQNLDLQLNALRERSFEDKISGVRDKRD